MRTPPPVENAIMNAQNASPSNANAAAVNRAEGRPIELPLGQLVQVIQRVQGRDLSGYEETFLARCFERRLVATSLDAAAYLTHLEKQDSAEADELTRTLTVAYSEFFRNSLTFGLLEQWVLPLLAERQGAAGQVAIRIWSAGCAAGQEPYSIAILLEDLAAARSEPVPFRIIATDVRAEELASARSGVYNHAAIQNVRVRHLDRCFDPRHGSYVLLPRLREWVDFSVYDLRDELSVGPPTGIYGDFDLVLCCNLLLYYRPEVRRVILNKLRRSLSPGGFLVTGESERSIVAGERGFQSLAPSAAVFRLTGRGP
jgi:chemotaxis protein methyltransferase CheR